jgi:outer membrane protein OmpA-like peptidoglycan-associated protein
MTMLIRKNIGIISVVAAVIFLGVCGVCPFAAESATKSMNPVEQVNRLEREISSARKNQMNILAPKSFSEAEEAFIDAKKRLDRGDSLAKILKKVAIAQAQLLRAKENARVAKTTMTDAIQAREFARSAGATNLGKDYAKAEEKFLRLTKAIESDNLKRAKRNEPEVVEAFSQLELRAIKVQTIGEARKLIQQADKEGARKIAPKTYAVAQEKLTEVDAFISKHRYQKVKMHAMASEALFQAERLLQIARQSQTIRTMRPEDITLWVEDILYKTSSRLSAPDMRDESLATQVDNILGSISALQDDHKYMVAKTKSQQAEIQIMKNQIASLEGLTQEQRAAKEHLEAERRAVEERLAAERRFNELFSEVRSYFASDEAEVYKQGSQLVIRLKAIQFPVGKDVIMPGNYALLSKVQRAIRTFGEPDILIEGHTDSTGTDEVNDHLSQRRADAVRQYFVANGTLPEDKIIAVGYGSKRPLASNETPEGRAINRRIDVFITSNPQTG